jgi:WD40 repeat protein
MIVSFEDGTPQVRGSFEVRNLTTTWLASFDFLPTTVAPTPTLIVGTGQLIHVWDVGEAPAVRLGTWNAQATVRGIAAAPDGTVALVRASGDLQFVDHKSLIAGTEPEPLSVVPGVVPPGQPGTLTFSADGRILALTNRVAGTVSVWDLPTKVSIGSSFAWSTPTSGFPSPDGKSLLVTSDTSTVLWSLDTALWAEKVCLAAGRNLTEAEWAKYFPGREYEVTCPLWPAKPKT